MQRSRLLAIGATAALLIGLASGGAPALAAAPNPYQVSINALSNTHVHPMSDSTAASTQPDLGAHGKSKNKSYPGLANIDSLANFTGLYRVQGQDSNGNPNDTWLYDTVGNAPGLGGTTTVNAPIVPVSLNLLDSKNNVAFSDSAAPFVAPTVNSRAAR
jgi:hypothetical protein